MGNRQRGQPITERDIGILVQFANKKENEIRQWYEEFHQSTDGNNFMSKRQFQQFYCRLKKKENLKDLAEHIFRAFDTDRSNSIDFHEFIVAFIATSDEKLIEKFRYAFEVFDMDGDTVIEKREAKKILDLIGKLVGLDDQEISCYTTTMMLTFDTNRDKRITRDEFIQGCLNDPTLARVIDPFKF